jgi:hypothetical protein
VGEVPAQPVQAIAPEAVEEGDPIDEFVEGSRVEGVEAEATRTDGADEACMAEDGEVLAEGGLGGVDAFEECPDGSLAIAECFENGPASRVGDGVEDGGVGASAAHGDNI